MTYKELRDSITTRLKVDSLRLGLPYTEYQDAWIYQLITQAESEIQRRILPTTLTITADIGTDYADPLPNNGAVGEAEQYWVLFPYDQITQTWDGVGSARQGYNAILYGLPKDFGKMRQVLVVDTNGALELTYLEPEDFALLDVLTDDYKYYTTYWDGSVHIMKLYPTPTSANMTFMYYKAIIPFIDNNLTSSDTVQLPPEYYTLIETKVMSNFFNEYAPKYEGMLKSLREYKESSNTTQILGNWLD